MSVLTSNMTPSGVRCTGFCPDNLGAGHAHLERRSDCHLGGLIKPSQVASSNEIKSPMWCVFGQESIVGKHFFSLLSLAPSRPRLGFASPPRLPVFASSLQPPAS